IQPVDDFEIGVEIDALQRRHPWLENLEPADRPVVTPLPRRVLARGPGRADAADEHEPCVARRRHLDGEFTFAEFFVLNHCCLSYSRKANYPIHHLPASMTSSPQTTPAR